MPDPIKVFSPRGQLVQGHPMKRNAVMDDVTKLQKINKKGEPRFQRYFAVAYPKNNSAVEAMVTQIKTAGPVFFDSRISATPDFAWKIEDGDSTVPNKRGKKNCDRAGFPDNHILKFTSELPDLPKVCDETKGDLFDDGDFKPGDFIRVGFKVTGNGRTDSPGLYIDPIVVQRLERGEALFTQRSAAEEIDGFDDGPVPSGQAPAPAQDFGVPPPPAAPRMVTNPQGNTQSYDAMIAKGWTDESLAAAGWK